MKIEKESVRSTDDDRSNAMGEKIKSTIGEAERDTLTEIQIQKYAAWIWYKMVNRYDAYVGYYAKEDGVLRQSKYLNLKFDFVMRCAAGKEQVVLYPMSTENMSKWVGWDLDNHHKLGAIEEQNIKYSREIVKRCAEHGLNILREDSDGRGGFHLWCIFEQPIKTLNAYRLAMWVIQDLCPWSDYVESQPETFPHWDKCPEGNYGYGLRIPGKHHKRNIYSNFCVGNRRLGWRESVDYLLDMKLNDPSSIPNEVYDHIVKIKAQSLSTAEYEEMDKDSPYGMESFYNEAITWESLLTKYGWTYVGKGSDKGREIMRWRHPTATQDHSATVGYCGNKIYVFSPNCQPLEKNMAYSKFQFYAYMEFDGDFEATNEYLLEKGLESE